MAHVLDTSAVLSVLLTAEGAERVVEILRAAGTQEEARVLVPFTVMEELELYLLRRLPEQVDPVLALVESWPIEIVESYPQWRHETVRLQTMYSVPLTIAWPAALAFLHSAQLVHQNPTFDAIPGLRAIKIS